MPLINCEINLDLNWSKNCVIVANNAEQGTTFPIIDTKLYVPVVTVCFYQASLAKWLSVRL